MRPGRRVEGGQHWGRDDAGIRAIHLVQQSDGVGLRYELGNDLRQQVLNRSRRLRPVLAVDAVLLPRRLSFLDNERLAVGEGASQRCILEVVAAYPRK